MKETRTDFTTKQPNAGERSFFSRFFGTDDTQKDFGPLPNIEYAETNSPVANVVQQQQQQQVNQSIGISSPTRNQLVSSNNNIATVGSSSSNITTSSPSAPTTPQVKKLTSSNNTPVTPSPLTPYQHTNSQLHSYHNNTSQQNHNNHDIYSPGVTNSPSSTTPSNSTTTTQSNTITSSTSSLVDAFIQKFQPTSAPEKKFWMPDNSSPACYECSTPFTTFKRRHHCRLCGQIFCWKCSQRSMFDNKNEKIRVCNFCYDRHINSTQSIDDLIIEPPKDSNEVNDDTVEMMLEQQQQQQLLLQQQLSQQPNYSPQLLDQQQMPYDPLQQQQLQQQQLQQPPVEQQQQPNQLLFSGGGIFGNFMNIQSPFKSREPEPSVNSDLEKNLSNLMMEIGSQERNYDLSSSDDDDDDDDDEIVLPSNQHISNDENTSADQLQQRAQRSTSPSTTGISISTYINNTRTPKSISQNRGSVTSFSMSSLPTFENNNNNNSSSNGGSNGGSGQSNRGSITSKQSSSYEKQKSILSLSTSPSAIPPTEVMSSSLSILPALISPPFFSSNNNNNNNNSNNTGKITKVKDLDQNPLKSSLPTTTFSSTTTNIITGSNTTGGLATGVPLVSPHKKQIIIPPSSLLFSDPSIISLKSHPKTTNTSKFLEKYPLPRKEQSFTLSKPLVFNLDDTVKQHPCYDAYAQHLKNIVKALLEKENLDERWMSIIIDLAHRACTNVRISVKDGDKMATTEYIKIKKVPGNSDGKSSHTSGTINTLNNVYNISNSSLSLTPTNSPPLLSSQQNKSTTNSNNINKSLSLKPDFSYTDGIVMSKILTHKKMKDRFFSPKILLLSCSVEYQRVENKFLFFDQLLQQEKEYLRMMVDKIAERKPDIVLVEKTVSRLAQDFLLQAGISLALNVKPKLLERLARCLKGDVLQTLDNIHDQSIQQSSSSISTSSSSSSNNNNSITLQPPTKKVNKMGTCGQFRVQTFTDIDVKEEGVVGKKTLMYFERCAPELGATIILRGATKKQLEKVKKILHFAIYVTHHHYLELKFLNDKSMTLKQIDGQKQLLSCSPLITYPDPQRYPSIPWKYRFASQHAQTKKSLFQSFYFPHGDTGQQQAVLQYTNEDEILGMGTADAFDQRTVYPIGKESILEHQSIAFTHSIFCTSNQCIPFELHAIDFYTENDMTLGEFLMKFCFNTSHVCTIKECNRTLQEHERTFLVANGRINICIQKCGLTSPTRSGIYIINRCKQCSNFSPEQQMTSETWEMSFGKFLELSFYGISTLVTNYSECSHSPMKDHITYFYYNDLAAIFSYEPLAVLELALPPKQFSKCDSKYRGEVLAKEVELLFECANQVYGAIFERFTELEEEGDQYGKELIPSLLEERQLIVAKIAQLMQDVCPVNNVEIVRLTKILYANFSTWNSQLNGITASTSYQKSKRNLTPTSSNPVSNIQQQADRSSPSPSYLDPTRNLIDHETTTPNSNGNGISPLTSPPTPTTATTTVVNNHVNGNNIVGQFDQNNSNQTPPISVTSPSTIVTSSTTMSASEGDTNNLLGVGSGIDPIAASHISYSYANMSQYSGSLSTTYISPNQQQQQQQQHLQQQQQQQQQKPKLKIIDTITNIVSSIASTKVLDPTIPFLLLDGSDNIAIYENEPSTTIAYTLVSQEFKTTFNELLEEELNKPSALLDNNQNPQGKEREISNFLKQRSATELKKHERKLSLGGTALTATLNNFNNGNGVQYSPSSTPPLSPQKSLSSDNSPINNHHSFIKPLDLDNNTIPSTNNESSPSIGNDNDNHQQQQQTQHEIFTERNLKLSKLLVSDQRKEIRSRFKFEKNGYELNIFCTTYYPVQFHALREIVCSEEQFVQSLTRSKPWVAKGGKSGSTWSKTLDDRYILKQVSRIELESFLDFAPLYFEYLCKSHLHQIPTALSKILGVYSVRWKDSNGKSLKKDLIVMENLFYRCNITKTYDLKGSLRSRLVKNESEVLLDENLLQSSFSSPICLGEYDKTRLSMAVWNDTAFLSSLNIMDYSLLTGIDNQSNQLIVGIIDYMRKFTWDKAVEMHVKQSGIMGGGGKVPTVISPKQYKIRFRDAMWLYFTMVPTAATDAKPNNNNESPKNNNNSSHNNNSNTNNKNKNLNQTKV